jgi:N-acetylglutamate synthase-like GNAT family acetyltransferase
MRGLRLFVRPIDASDYEAVGMFLAKETSLSSTAPASGLLGKLLGDIVAVVAIELTPDAVRIEDIIVARDLRKKRIGRVMMNELEQLAAKMDRRRMVVEDARDAHEFFRHVGFRIEGDRWVRDVSS